MDIFIRFFSFSDPNVRYVVLGTSLLMTSSALVGTFSVLQKKALVGDAVSHAVLPGVCLAFLINENKSTLGLVIGAFISGWISLIMMDKISQYSKIKQDAAIAIVLSSFFGLGLLLLTYIQQSGNASQAGLNNFLLGKTISLVWHDIIVLITLSIFIVIVTTLLFKEFFLLSFDRNFAKAIGFPVRFIELIMTSMIVLAIVIGIRAVGILLMSAMLITPATAARFWTDKLQNMICLAIIFGILSGILGSFVSYTAPSMATGPWIVIVATIIAYASFLFAPGKGLVARKMSRLRYQQKALEENILKLLYELGLEDNNPYKPQILHTILKNRPMPLSTILACMKKLIYKGMVLKDGEWYGLSSLGMERGKQILKLHSLWEFYLTKYLRIKPDHVHDDAEAIEHVITPELALELERLMKQS
jgi:manganese/zinc/iron transport system permease protein